MWFKLEATSCLDGIEMYEKYSEDLSAFNVRVLNVPNIHFSDLVLMMDVLVLVELGTIEELIRLKDRLDLSLILRKDDKLIEIYDDWRE